MTDDLIDRRRSSDLGDVGLPGFVAAILVDEDGAQHPVVVDSAVIGDPTVRFDPLCARTAPHEQLGALPLEFVRRITISRRTYRCGRPTKAGPPCRISVTREGDPCAWHGQQANTTTQKPKGTPNA